MLVLELKSSEQEVQRACYFPRVYKPLTPCIASLALILTVHSSVLSLTYYNSRLCLLVYPPAPSARHSDMPPISLSPSCRAPRAAWVSSFS
jgi:hypothetical protein